MSQDRGFLTELISQLCLPEGAPTSVEGSGKEALVLAQGNSVYKVFASSKAHCGASAHAHEIRALTAFGGHEGKSIFTPQIKSHFLFQSSVSLMGTQYVGMIEQSRITGVRPDPQTPFQLADIGNAIGEFHNLLNQSDQKNSFTRDIIDLRTGILMNKKAGAHCILPGLRKKLLNAVSAIAIDTSHKQLVHGDLHMGNVLFDGRRYGFIDLATIGRSVPEQDMTCFATKPDCLKEVFKGYAAQHNKKPVKGRVMALYGLDLGIAAECAHRSGQQEKAKKMVNELQALFS